MSCSHFAHSSIISYACAEPEFLFWGRAKGKAEGRAEASPRGVLGVDVSNPLSGEVIFETGANPSSFLARMRGGGVGDTYGYLTGIGCSHHSRYHKSVKCQRNTVIASH